MTSAQAKRIALLGGPEDPMFVRALSRALGERGYRAQRVSPSGLKVALRPPDLTVILGGPDDGGVEAMETVGADRGPFAVVMPPGALAARLEARRVGLHVIPGQDEPLEVADGIDKLMAELAAGAASSPPSQPPPNVALDALDWDDDPETVEKRDADVEAWRKARGLGRPSQSPASRGSGDRSTLPGGISLTPPAMKEREPGGEDSLEDLTLPSLQPLQIADVHEAVTKPHTIDPDAVDPHEGTTRQVVLPPSDEEETVDAPFGYETLDDPYASLDLARKSASSDDPDRTAPHRPVMAGDAGERAAGDRAAGEQASTDGRERDPDTTAPQRPVALKRSGSGGSPVVPKPGSSPSRPRVPKPSSGSRPAVEIPSPKASAPRPPAPPKPVRIPADVEPPPAPPRP
ncbi:MAG TPA: hypothetical protein RMH99_02850, partial [Sandaracinaceae bacterium LLY-WYZ-13_1]|nr:hypothetical protein [Sandaracinaceae bacterium LLY-WYZ-13_1]